MILGATVFFRPDWPRRMLHDLKERHRYRIDALTGEFVIGFLMGGFQPEIFSFFRALFGGMGAAVGAYHLDEPLLRRT